MDLSLPNTKLCDEDFFKNTSSSSNDKVEVLDRQKEDCEPILTAKEHIRKMFIIQLEAKLEKLSKKITKIRNM